MDVVIYIIPKKWQSITKQQSPIYRLHRRSGSVYGLWNRS